MSNDKRTFFYVPKANYAKLASAIERLSKRSQKAGGWAIELTRFGTIDGKDGKPDCYEVFIDAPDVRLDGYTFIARLDHSQETGNIIRMLPNIDLKELPVEYRTAAPKCDHCNINRQRRDTYVLAKEDGSLVQLGSSCMADFFQTDPRAIMKLAELVGYAREAAAASEQDDFLKGRFKMADLRTLPLEDYLLHCAVAMRKERERTSFGNGFVSSRGNNPTKRAALSSYFEAVYTVGGVDPVTDEDREQVEKALGWIDVLAERRDAGKNLSQFEHNLLVVGQASYIEKRAIGIAAAIVGCYERGLRDIARTEQPVIVKPEPKPEPLMLKGMMGVIELFRKAGAKLKWPKITISFPDTGEIVLSVAGPSSQFPGSINVKSTGGYDNAAWFGRIHTDGRWEPTRSRQANLPEGLEAALVAFAADPAGVSAEYGKRTGQCCFCHKGLTDPKSAAVGYGATCAKNYGLPYGVAAMKAALAA